MCEAVRGRRARRGTAVTPGAGWPLRYDHTGLVRLLRHSSVCVWGGALCTSCNYRNVDEAVHGWPGVSQMLALPTSPVHSLPTHATTKVTRQTTIKGPRHLRASQVADQAQVPTAGHTEYRTPTAIFGMPGSQSGRAIGRPCATSAPPCATLCPHAMSQRHGPILVSADYHVLIFG